jgi:Ala-tRNA(Pro) deacylase
MTDTEHLLADGSTPATPDELFARLGELGIDTRTIQHVAVFTVEESRALRGDLPGGHTKNLFLRNKKGGMWLLVCPEDLALDLKSLAEKLGAGRFSFASAHRLMKYLGVIPGAVTPFGVINDTGGHVTVVIDRTALEVEPLNFHPLDNAMTTAIGASDLLKFLEAEGHAPELVDLADVSRRRA